MMQKQGFDIEQVHPTSQALSKYWQASESFDSTQKAGLGYQEDYSCNVVMLGEDSDTEDEELFEINKLA